MNRIKHILKQQGRSQKWLSENLRKSYIIITNYCINKVHPSLIVLNKIADILDVDGNELLKPTKV